MRVVIGDRKLRELDNNNELTGYRAELKAYNNYYPYHSIMPGRNFNSTEYRYGGANGQEKDDEIKGSGNSYDFGARIYDPRVGRWLSVDPLAISYPFASPFNFALNTPIQAFDPDGNLVIFVNGLMLNQALASDNRLRIDYDPDPKYQIFGPNPNYRPYPTHEMSTDGPTYLGETFGYWGNIDDKFNDRLNDYNNLYVSGSNHTWSEAVDRYKAGQQSGYELIAKIQNGEITLAEDETIKIVGHSQGAAHAAGIAAVLQEAYDNGTVKNAVEQIYLLAPHQATQINVPENIFSVQYSRQSDLVSSRGIVSTELISGGSKFGPVKGITEFIQLPDMLGKGNGLLGTRGGHDVSTFREIFNIRPNSFGGVTPSPPSKSRSQVGPLREDGTF